jgi:hypothetical protein
MNYGVRNQGRGMKRLLFVGSLLLLAGCGSGSTTTTTTTTPVISISGPWAITAQSQEQLGNSTLIESNIQQATETGATDSETINATGVDQLVLFGQHPSGGLFFGGLCPGATAEGLTGTLSSTGALALTLTEGAATYTLTGTVNSSGNSLSGTYLFVNGICPDSGTFTGVQVSALAGSYAGDLIFTNGNHDHATATLTEGVPSSFTVALTLTGDDNTTVTLTGFVVGNAFSVQGTLNGQAVSYYGYYALSQKAVYLVDASTGIAVGTLFTP